MITIFCEKIVKTAISLRAWCKVVQDLYQAAETGLLSALPHAVQWPGYN